MQFEGLFSVEEESWPETCKFATLWPTSGHQNENKIEKSLAEEVESQYTIRLLGSSQDQPLVPTITCSLKLTCYICGLLEVDPARNPKDERISTI